MKKLLAVVLAVSLFLSVVSSAKVSVSAAVSGNFTYTIHADPLFGEYAEITQYSGSDAFVEIPAVLGGKPVREIGIDAFLLSVSMTRVYIPDSVVSIKMNAFKNCTELTAVTFPASVESIDFNAFRGCSKLAKVFFLGNAPWMGIDVFLGCRPYSEFRAYYLQGSTGFSNPWQTYITTAVFSPLALPVLTPSTTTPTNSTVTVSATFQGDEIYREYRLFNGTWQPYNAPIVLSANTVVYVRAKNAAGQSSTVAQLLVQNIAYEGMVYTFDTYSFTATITDYIGSGGVLNIPEHIGDYAVTAVAANAFDNTPGLTSVSFPKTLLTIGSWSFSGCPNLASVSFGTGVTTIGNSAFRNCSALTSVTLPNSIQTLGESVFLGCTALTYAQLGSGIREINLNTFQGCSSLARILLPDGLQWIQANAFKDCIKLKYVVIPDSVTYIGTQAFKGCSLLADAWFMGDAPTLSTAVFENCSSEFTVRCRSEKTGFTQSWYSHSTIAIFQPLPAPTISVGDTAPTTGTVTVTVTYPDTKAADYDHKEYLLSGSLWCYYTGPLTVSSNTTVSARYAGYNGHPSFTGTMDVTNIYKFSYTVSNGEATVTTYRGPTAAVIPQTIDGYPIVSIGEGAFHFAHTVTSVSLPVGLRTIQDYAFASSGLQTVSLPSTLLSIGYRAFYANASLTEVILPDALESLGTEAFEECSSLTEIFIPRNVRSIGLRCFLECAALTSIHVDASNTMFSSANGVLFNRGLNQLLVYPADGPTEYLVPSSVTYIEEYAFASCAKLEKLTISSAVFYIGEDAFEGYSDLTIYGYAGSVAQTCAANYGIPFVVLPAEPLTAAPTSSTVIDRENGLIYGLRAGLSAEGFEADYVRVGPDVTLVYSTPGNLGTGTRVDVVGADQAVIETYYIVLFGDVNADGTIDGNDAGVLEDVYNWRIFWTAPENNLLIKAADINADGVIDAVDADILVDVENWVMSIDQTTGRSYPIIIL